MRTTGAPADDECGNCFFEGRGRVKNPPGGTCPVCGCQRWVFKGGMWRDGSAKRNAHRLTAKQASFRLAEAYDLYGILFSVLIIGIPCLGIWLLLIEALRHFGVL